MSAGPDADRAVSILSDLKLAAEIYVEENLITSVAVASGKIESLEVKEELGAGVRVFDSGRTGFAYTSDLSSEGIGAAAAAARAFSAHTDAEASNVLPQPEALSLPDPETGDLSIAGIEAYRKVAIARATEEAARALDPRVTKVRQARYSDVVGRVELRGTQGLSRGASFARLYGSIELVAEQGSESQSGYASDFALRLAGLDPFKIGREAARRAIAKLGGTRAATRKADLILDPEAAGLLLDAFSPALSAENVLKSKSILAGRVGQKVAGPGVSLVDDGRFPGANRTFPFDAEGVQTRRVVLIEGGVLRGFLHDWRTSTRMGAESTGSAVRSSYMSPPRIAPANLYLVPSALSRQKVLEQVADGFYISELLGLHTIDTITGEFSLGAIGQRVRSGVLEEPVTGIGMAGNFLDLLSGIEAVAGDLKLLTSGTAGSTTLVRGVTISGT